MTGLRAFTITTAPIPFRTSFAHASAIRSRAENVLVVAEDEEGRVGIGEGCPRPYVTGETCETAQAFLEAHRASLMGVADLAALRNWIAAHQEEIDASPSAFCAAELALMDLLGQRCGQSLEGLLGIKLTPTLSISAVYGASGDFKFALQETAFGAFGLRDSKMKLSGSPRRDRARVSRLARRGPVRLDANNMFVTAADAIEALGPMRSAAWAVEEPVSARDWPALARITDETGLAVIADESLTTLADLRAMPAGFVPNLRVSKLGGLIRSLHVLDEALKQGRRVIVGAQVGETSILARAGVTLASAAGPHLAACEIGYGPWLLRRDVATPSLGFGWQGVLHAKRVGARPGAGLSYNGEIVVDSLDPTP
jgi:L-alanine-DL-glutamate epimerase-like enolase superfamily enzyme